MEVRTKNILKWSVLGILIIVIGIASGSMIYIYSNLKAYDKVFIKGVQIEGIPVGGLTPEEAKEKLYKVISDKQDKEIVDLNKLDQHTVLTLGELDPLYNTEAVLEEAFKLGKEGNIFERYSQNKTGVKLSSFTLKPTFTKENITKALAQHSEMFYVAPIDATITRKNRQFVTTKEVPGVQLNVSATTDLIMDRLEQDSISEAPIKLEAITEVVNPKYTTEAFKDVQTPIASFHTSYNNADPSRNENLKVATQKINKVLEPGEVFSLAKQLEPINAAAGYKPSKVIVNGKLEDGIGGGVCQVASTLYNAVLLSNLDITVRQNHSLPVAYVPLGRDATYATGIIDFKFQNNSDKFVFIESYCENNNVFVNIFGNASLKPTYDEIKFLSETVEIIPPPPTKFVNDSEIEKGKQIQELRPLEGKKVKLYKLCYKNGEVVKKELINQSYYKPRGEVIKVGTKEAVPAVKNDSVPLPKATPKLVPVPSKEPEVNMSVDEWPGIDLEGTDALDIEDDNPFEIPQQ